MVDNARKFALALYRIIDLICVFFCIFFVEELIGLLVYWYHKIGTSWTELSLYFVMVYYNILNVTMFLK